MIVLASQSPRRQMLLQQLGLSYEPAPVNIDETVRSGESPQAYVQRMANEKATTAYHSLADKITDHTVILAADTAVVIHETILGKPLDFEHYQWMMNQLSGVTHQVYSGLCLINRVHSCEKLNISNVSIDPLPASFIESYWNSKEPADKAGGYAIQGMMACYIREIQGSYSGIMGLPLYELSQALRQIGYNPSDF